MKRKLRAIKEVMSQQRWFCYLDPDDQNALCGGVAKMLTIGECGNRLIVWQAAKTMLGVG